MQSKFKFTFCILLLITAACESPRPQLTKADRIFDEADVFSPAQEDSLFTLINEVDATIGSQIAVMTIDTLNGEKIEEFTMREFERLGIGRKKENDGILITLAMKDHGMRIDVGYGLEGIVKDEIAGRIIRNNMTPKFREGKFCLGVYDAIDSMKYLIENNRELVGKRAQ